MTVKELIAKLAVLPPEAMVDDGKCPCEELDVKLMGNKVYIARRYEELWGV